MKKFRELICTLFGHRSIMVGLAQYMRDGIPWSTNTAHICERCDHRTENQWDY